MPSFYFEQLLRTGLNGIDQQGITAAVLQIAGVVLILSLLWSVYEAYSNGGDVRLLGVAAVKYLVLGLVFLNYQSAFRAVNTMFNSVADGIYNLSGGVDVIKAWGNSLSQAWQTNPNWFSSLWNLVTGGISAIVAGLITLIGYLILPFTYTLFTLFYALYGSILYVVGPFVLALIPSRGLGQVGRTYFVNMMIFQCWGLLYAILQSLMSALQITDPMQFNGSFLQAFVGSSQMIVMSVASVLLSIMIALIPFIASRIVRGDVGSTLMTVISGVMTAGAVASGLASAGGGGLAAGRQASSGGPPSPPSGGSGAPSQGSGVVGQSPGGGAVTGGIQDHPHRRVSMGSMAQPLRRCPLAVRPLLLEQFILLHRAIVKILPSRDRLLLPGNQPVATTAAALPVSRLGKPDTWLAEPCAGQGWVQNHEKTTVEERSTGDRQLHQVLRTRRHVARIRQSRHVSGDLVCCDRAQFARVRDLCPHPATHGHPRR